MLIELGMVELGFLHIVIHSRYLWVEGVETFEKS